MLEREQQRPGLRQPLHGHVAVHLALVCVITMLIILVIIVILIRGEIIVIVIRRERIGAPITVVYYCY